MLSTACSDRCLCALMYVSGASGHSEAGEVLLLLLPAPPRQGRRTRLQAPPNAHRCASETRVRMVMGVVCEVSCRVSRVVCRVSCVVCRV
eukprot:683417-Rhodomonas_salina.1